MGDLRYYEMLLLAHTEVTDDELSMIESKLEKIVSEADGKVSVFDKWGKYQLAYPVNNNSYGVYALVRYQVPKKSLGDIYKEIDTFIKIKCNEIVLRYVTVKDKQAGSSVYLKPEALESVRSSGLDAAKESKIEHLLDSVDSSTKEAKSEKSSSQERKPTEVIEKQAPTEERNASESLEDSLSHKEDGSEE